MKNQPATQLASLSSILLILKICLLSIACNKPASAKEADEKFYKELTERSGGDYVATLPLHNPDSCIIRLKNEIPAHMQPWFCLSIWERLPRNPDLSVNFRLLDLYEKNYPHDTVSAIAQTFRGDLLAEMKLHDTARLVLEDARRRCLRLNRPLDALDTDRSIAGTYFNENKTAKALEIYFRMLDLLNRHTPIFSERHEVLHLDISAAYSRVRDYPKELFWLKKAMQSDHSKLAGAHTYRMTELMRMSSCYARMDNLDSSLMFAKMARDTFRARSQKPLPIELAYRLGYAYSKTGDCASAHPFLWDAFQRSATGKSLQIRKNVELHLGEVFNCLGKRDSAELFYKKLLDATVDTTNLMTAYSRLAKIHADAGDFKTAYKEEKLSGSLSRKLFDTEKATAFADFQTRFDATEQAHRISELEKERKIHQQQSLIIGLFAFSGIGFLLSLFLRQRTRQRMLKQEKQLLETNQTLLEQQNQLLEKDKTLLAQEKQLAETRELLKAQELERAEANLRTTKDELDTTTRLLQLKNQLIEELEMRLHEQFAAPSDNLEAAVPRAAGEDLHRMKILTDSDWVKFRERFEASFPGFMLRLKTQFPSLTAAETRLFLLIKLRFSNQEMSETLGISIESIYRSRHRLSKKVGLTDTGNLDGLVDKFH